MSIKKTLLFILIINCISVSYAQIPIGSFQDHLPYNGFQSIAVTPERVYAASNYSLLFYDKNDASLNTLSKVEGLSETLISTIFYEPNSGYLVVAYQNANLDFIKNNQLKNVADIKNKTITGDKTINNFLSHNDLLYVVCSFGIVTVDLKTLLIRDTWYTQNGNLRYEVNEMAVFENSFYLATDKGVFYSDCGNPALADFSTWQHVPELGNSKFTIIQPFNNKLYLVKNGLQEQDTVITFHNNSWEYNTQIHPQMIRSLNVSDNELLLGAWSYIEIYDTAENSIYYASWEEQRLWHDARDAHFDGQTIWVADNNNGLVQIFRQWGSSKVLTADGPYSTAAFKMDCQKGVLALAPGAVNSVWNNSYIPPNLSFYSNYQWTNILQKDFPVLSNSYDITTVAVNPRNTNDIYAGIFRTGLAKYSQGKLIEIFNRDNSPLHSGDTLEAAVSGLSFDEYGNLWIATSYSTTPLTVLKSDGTWQSFTLAPYIAGNAKAVGQIVTDSRNFKWITLPRDNTIIVFDDNNTISDLSDDDITRVDMNVAANIETSSVNCVAEDKKGQIWIGANQGIKVIYNPANIFAGTAHPQNILLEQINYVQNLFEFEEVTALAVDEANRKWVGTAKSGVFLISEDGSDELLHFTEDNSPLFSDKILDICINDENGEVFFATLSGLISYRGTATIGKENFDEVLVFPNPVRETYHGTIAVSGLMDNSFCKIADASGSLLWQGYANGGELTWDGKDFYGNRVATGVYFVFSSDQSGKEKNVAKILFIK